MVRVDGCGGGLGADQARRREAGGSTCRNAWPRRRCAAWWRDGPEAARACCARRVGVCEAAHVRLGATMAIEFAERRNAIVCRGCLRGRVDGLCEELSGKLRHEVPEVSVFSRRRFLASKWGEHSKVRLVRTTRAGANLASPCNNSRHARTHQHARTPARTADDRQGAHGRTRTITNQK